MRENEVLKLLYTHVLQQALIISWMNLFATFEKMSISDEKFKKFTMYLYLQLTIILYNYTTIQLQCTTIMYTNYFLWEYVF